jgi:hypothetical protein
MYNTSMHFECILSCYKCYENHSMHSVTIKEDCTILPQYGNKECLVPEYAYRYNATLEEILKKYCCFQCCWDCWVSAAYLTCDTGYQTCKVCDVFLHEMLSFSPLLTGLWSPIECWKLSHYWTLCNAKKCFWVGFFSTEMEESWIVSCSCPWTTWKGYNFHSKSTHSSSESTHSSSAHDKRK